MANRGAWALLASRDPPGPTFQDEGGAGTGAGAEEPEPAHVRVYALTAEAYAADVDAQLKLLGGLGLRGVRFARLPHEAIAEE